MVTPNIDWLPKYHFTLWLPFDVKDSAKKRNAQNDEKIPVSKCKQIKVNRLIGFQTNEVF